MEATKRLGFYVTKPDGSVDFKVGAAGLEQDSLDEVYEITKVITKLQPIFVAYELMRRNLSPLVGFGDSAKDQCKQYQKSGVIPTRVLIDLNCESSRLISNFLSSSNSILDHLQSFLKREFGEKSSEFINWDESRKDLHHQNFSYRFLYGLRHFSQHYSLPLTNLQMTGGRDSIEEEVDFQFGILIQRDKTIQSGFDWRGLKEEILGQLTEFDLVSLCDDLLKHLTRLFLMAVSFNNQELARCASYFNYLNKILDPPSEAEIAVFSGDFEGEEMMATSFKIIPIAEFNWQETIVVECQKILA